MNSVMDYLLTGWRVSMHAPRGRFTRVWLKNPDYPFIYATVNI